MPGKRTRGDRRLEDALAALQRALRAAGVPWMVIGGIAISFGWTAFEHEALGELTRARFGKIHVPMASPEDLVILKAIAARPKDIEDAAALLALYPSIHIRRVRAKVRELAAMADETTPIEALDEIVKLARGATKRRRRK